MPAEAATEVKWEEIWRPRRPRGQQHRQHRRPHHRQKPNQETGQKTDAPAEAKSGEHRRDNNRPDRQPRPFMQSASPKANVGIDPDSPFAALSRLKAAMEKPNSE